VAVIYNEETGKYEKQSAAKGRRTIEVVGIDGRDGKDGKDGERGEKGEKGDKGDTGAQGQKGERGEKGDKGEKGDRGADGKDGKDGKDAEPLEIRATAEKVEVKAGKKWEKLYEIPKPSVTHIRGMGTRFEDVAKFFNPSGVTINNDTQQITVEGGGGGSTPSGVAGAVQISGGTTLDSDEENFFYDKPNKRLGINTDTPEGVLHVKDTTYEPPPEPTGTVSLTETTGSSWFNEGNSFAVRVYTYKVVEGVTLYSSTFIDTSYVDDFGSDHYYNLLVEVTDALPSGADGYRAFMYWDNNVPENQWNFNQYVQFTDLDATVTTSNTTAGTPVSGVPAYKAIIENAETWLKNSTVRFMDSSGNTKAIWDKVNERLGVGTATPSQFAHFASTATTLPPNPTGTATATQVEDVEGAYVAEGNAFAYRIFTYKLVGGQIILSNLFLTASMTDDESSNNFYVNIAMSASVPSGANGYFITKNTTSYAPTAYWIGGTNIIDNGNATVDNSAQFSRVIGRVLVDTANMEFLQNGLRTMFYDAYDGSFNKLKIKTTSIGDTALRIDCVSGQTANPIDVYNSVGGLLFRVTSAGALQFGAGLTATTGSFSSTLSVTGVATLGNNVTVAGTLAVTSAATFNSTFTSRSGTCTATNSSSVGLTINGVSGQSGSLQEWRATAGGTILARISSIGGMNVANVVGYSSNNSSGTSILLLNLDGANNLVCRNNNSTGGAFYGCNNAAGVVHFQSGSTNRHTIAANGQFVFNTSSTGTAANVTPVQIRATAAQTADLTQWTDSAGTAIAYITAAGRLGLKGTAAGLATLHSVNSDIIISNGLGGTATFRLLPFGSDCYFDNTTSGAHIFRYSSGTEVFRLSPTTQTGLLTVPSAAVKGLSIKAASAQTANLFETQDSASATQLAIAANGRDFILDTTTGSKIGTATTQKLGLWNATPIVQPTTAVTEATFVVNSGGSIHPSSTFDGYTIAQVVRALRNIGALA
jgi:hypothetical protein